ncbi:MAG: hypothetical protein R3231_05840 [bacterium]|nr:hypothetical protein [bacterium]
MYINHNPTCPHCRKMMEKVETPFPTMPEYFGFGPRFLWICSNDECSLFVNGWKNMAEKYGELTSIRYMIEPESGETGVFPVPTASLFDNLFPNDTDATDSDWNRSPKGLMT